MFERRHQPLLPRAHFVGRMARSLAVAAGLLLVSLAVGILGYRWLAGLDWVDALLNASMILTGMGPMDRMGTTAGKLFTSAYAIFSGVAFLTAIGIIVAPLLHRFFHHFHLDLDEEEREEQPAAPKPHHRHKPE